MSSTHWDEDAAVLCSCGESVALAILGAHLRDDHLGSLDLIWRCGACEFESATESELLTHAFRRRHAPEAAHVVVARAARLLHLAQAVYAQNLGPDEHPLKEEDEAGQSEGGSSEREPSPLPPSSAAHLLLSGPHSESGSPSMVAPPPRLLIPSSLSEDVLKSPFFFPGDAPPFLAKSLSSPGIPGSGDELGQSPLEFLMAAQSVAGAHGQAIDRIALMRLASQIRKRRKFENIRRHQPWMNANDTRSRSSCAKCGGRFLIHDRKGRLNTSVLSNHAALHFPIPPYRCGNCSYQSARKANVENHIMRIHAHSDGAVLDAQSNYSDLELRRQLEETMRVCFPQFTGPTSPRLLAASPAPPDSAPPSAPPAPPPTHTA